MCSISLPHIFVQIHDAAPRSGSTEHLIASNSDQKEAHQTAAVSDLASPLAPNFVCLACCTACCSFPKAKTIQHLTPCGPAEPAWQAARPDESINTTKAPQAGTAEQPGITTPQGDRAPSNSPLAILLSLLCTLHGPLEAVHQATLYAVVAARRALLLCRRAIRYERPERLPNPLC